MDNIGFNKPYFSGNEIAYIQDAVAQKHISGNGKYTKLCHDFFVKRYGFKKCLLTTSCTDALEMAAILINIQSGDEVIMPSFTFVSTANAFVLRGAKIVFADSHHNYPSLDENKITSLITPKTKAIVVVHYAGVACNIDAIMELAATYNLFVIEDAAQAIDSVYTSKNGNTKPLGSIGHLAAFSFHETKNISSGEGGMLVVNDEKFIERAEIIWEKGTNRSAFFRGETDKYGWVDIGSSFLPSDIIAAFLYAQLECLDTIQKKRKEIWKNYYSALLPLEENGKISLPHIPEYASNNAHMFYILCKHNDERNALVDFLKRKKIHAVFHYQSLHKSKFYELKHDSKNLPNCDNFSDTLLRLPFYFELTDSDQSKVASAIKEFYQQL
jgi:dTDP-4-amino-4,6-dideoxygalactose transaminase